MSFKVIYAAKVYEDLQEAVDFYNSREKGLGIRFFKSVKIQISQIKSNVYAFQVRYDDVHCAPLKSFPYTVHYRVVAATNTIMVLAVFCDYRDPKKWDSRSI